MGGAHEALEHAEHIEHAGHGKGPGKAVGITMALLGVMLAACAALVGSERTEFIKTVVEQANTFNEYQASSTKYRLLLSELQQTYAVTPSRALADKYVKDFEAMTANLKPEQAEIANAVKYSTRETLRILQPRQHEVAGFVSSIQRYEKERKLAQKWAESYSPEAETHFVASEWYEKAQLASEIGIVIASIALLMASRPFWFVSLVAAAACAGLIGYTWFSTHKHLTQHCDEGDHEKGVAPPIPIAWDPPAEGHEAKKSDEKVCVPGAMQRIHHTEHAYASFRARKVKVGDHDMAFRELSDRAVTCRVIKRFDIDPNPADCNAIVEAMDAVESGKLKIEGEGEHEGGHEGGHEPGAHSGPAHSGEPAHAPAHSGEPAHAPAPSSSGATPVHH